MLGKTHRTQLFGIVLAAMVVVSFASVSQAVFINLFSANLSTNTSLYNGPYPLVSGQPAYKWYMPSGGYSSAIFKTDTNTVIPVITAQKVVWTGSPLLSDTSSGDVASGTFGSGGLFQIWGTVNYSGLHSGLLFEGTVGAFTVTETYNNNRIDIGGSPVITPTTNASAYFNNAGLVAAYYRLNMLGVQVLEDNADLWDLQGNLKTSAGAQFNLVGVPEPSCLVMLLVSSFSLVRIRRHR